MWHTLRESRLTGDAAQLTLADDVRRVALRRSPPRATASGCMPTRRMGRARPFLHDANDIPLVLAPVWGPSADDPLWRAWTSYSAANEGGCYGGRLGSVHARPGRWVTCRI